jgi:hypothetical protein
MMSELRQSKIKSKDLEVLSLLSKIQINFQNYISKKQFKMSL